MFPYRTRLARDLARWQAEGWLTADNAVRIHADMEARRSPLGLAHVLATLAAALIGFAAMSFVAANWQEMSKLLRLATIFGGLWALLAGAGGLFQRGRDAFAHAALLAATAVFGAGIMLIAQMYHMDGHPPDAVLVWGAGTVATGLLLRSNPVLAAALVLFSVWTLMEMFGRGVNGQIHWGFLPAWAAVAAGFAWTRWRPGLHLLAVALAGWLILSGYMPGDRVARGHIAVGLIGLALAGASIAFGAEIDRWRRISAAMLNYGIVIAFAGMFALQFIVDRPGDRTLVYGALVLVAIVGALAWAWRTDNRAALWITYAAFSIEIFALYLKKIGTLLGTSAFFLITGLIVSALAYAAFRLHGGAASRSGANR